MKLDDIGKIYYFAYGHNTDSEVLKRRAPSAVFIGNALLKNFKLTFKDFSNIENQDGARVQGILWHIDRADLKNLDHDEGYHEHYNRIPVEVHCEGSVYQATTYIMDPNYVADSTPSSSYITDMMKGYREHGIPVIQIKRALEELKRSTNRSFETI